MTGVLQLPCGGSHLENCVPLLVWASYPGGSVVLSDSLYIDAVPPHKSPITQGNQKLYTQPHKLPSAGIMVSGISTPTSEAVGVVPSGR